MFRQIKAMVFVNCVYETSKARKLKRVALRGRMRKSWKMKLKAFNRL